MSLGMYNQQLLFMVMLVVLPKVCVSTTINALVYRNCVDKNTDYCTSLENTTIASFVFGGLFIVVLLCYVYKFLRYQLQLFARRPIYCVWENPRCSCCCFHQVGENEELVNIFDDDSITLAATHMLSIYVGVLLAIALVLAGIDLAQFVEVYGINNQDSYDTIVLLEFIDLLIDAAILFSAIWYMFQTLVFCFSAPWTGAKFDPCSHPVCSCMLFVLVAFLQSLLCCTLCDGCFKCFPVFAEATVDGTDLRGAKYFHSEL